MKNIKGFLKYLELAIWALAFIIVAMVYFQILNHLFFIGAKVTTDQVVVRIYLSLIFVILPLVVKGARYSIRNI